MGVKTVVDLRREPNLIQEEGSRAEAAGLVYYSFPMLGEGTPTDEEMSKILAALDDKANWPVFVHCKRGADRTGTVIACYRIAHDRWQPEQALTEATQFGMRSRDVALRAYISNFVTVRASQNRSARPAPDRKADVQKGTPAR
jgi:tyrosine-protein phosphatase SIW14